MKPYCLAIGAVVLGGSSGAFADPPPATSAPARHGTPPLMAPGPSFGPPAPRAVPMVTHSPGLIAGGIVFLSVGVLSLMGATTAIIADQRGGGEFQGFVTGFIGIPLVVHGLGCVAAGIPMTAVGAKKIPAPSVWWSASLRPSTLGWTF